MLNFKIKKDKNGNKYLETPLKGKVLLTMPQLNKGTAFTKEERDALGLHGKLPTTIETIDEQVNRVYKQYQSYDSSLHKNIFLNELNDTNQILFYRLVKDHLSEMLPIVYTPTVGLAVEKFSREFQQARGLYISMEDQDRIEEILDNRTHPNIDLIVVTDGGGVLGIGDQGTGAMLIPIAKLMVYGLAGGINPLRTLPIMLDSGTDNLGLRNDPFYLGTKHERVSGKKYDQFIEKFVTAVKKKFPNVFLHWEDFGRANAARILTKYRDDLCTFNDDIQGTGVVALAALLAGVKANKGELKDQKIVMFGAGTAGVGIAEQIVESLIHNGLTKEEAHARFWMIDRPGLLADTMQNLTEGQALFARPHAEVAGWELQNPGQIMLYDVVKNVKPTVLMGCSAVGGAFTEEIVKMMASNVERPMIFPLSNPTDRAEATPSDCLHWTNGKALIATGSPFEPVKLNSHTIPIGQCNNALAFPGIGLGILATGATRCNMAMLWAACKALRNAAPVLQDPNGALLPNVKDAEETATKVAMAVAQAARDEGVATRDNDLSVEELIEKNRWEPMYLPYKSTSK